MILTCCSNVVSLADRSVECIVVSATDAAGAEQELKIDCATC
jgi:hypothetical protein